MGWAKRRWASSAFARLAEAYLDVGSAAASSRRGCRADPAGERNPRVVCLARLDQPRRSFEVVAGELGSGGGSAPASGGGQSSVVCAPDRVSAGLHRGVLPAGARRGCPGGPGGPLPWSTATGEPGRASLGKSCSSLAGLCWRAFAVALAVRWKLEAWDAANVKAASRIESALKAGWSPASPEKQPDSPSPHR